MKSSDNGGMKPNGGVGEKNSDHERRNFNDRRRDEEIGMKSTNEDGMKMNRPICGNSSDKEKWIGATNFNIEKRLYAERSYDCENSGYGKKKFDNDNDRRSYDKKYYVERSGDCKNSSNGKRNFSGMKRLYIRGSDDCKISGDGKKISNNGKRLYARGSGDSENSNDDKRNFNSEKRFYVRGRCDCERMGSSCNNSCGGEGSDPPQTTMTSGGLDSGSAKIAGCSGCLAVRGGINTAVAGEGCEEVREIFLKLAVAAAITVGGRDRRQRWHRQREAGAEQQWRRGASYVPRRGDWRSRQCSGSNLRSAEQDGQKVGQSITLQNVGAGPTMRPTDGLSGF